MNTEEETSEPRLLFIRIITEHSGHIVVGRDYIMVQEDMDLRSLQFHGALIVILKAQIGSIIRIIKAEQAQQELQFMEIIGITRILGRL